MSAMENISLRPLERRDLPLMLEWMRDPEISQCYAKDFSAMTAGQAERFIDASRGEAASRHFAFVNAADEYLGTVSLKNITASDAEYAIATRRCAQGTDAPAAATALVLRYAFERLRLRRVYLSVKADNARAQRFYDKCGFVRDAEAYGGGYCPAAWTRPASSSAPPHPGKQSPAPTPGSFHQPESAGTRSRADGLVFMRAINAGNARQGVNRIDH